MNVFMKQTFHKNFSRKQNTATRSLVSVHKSLDTTIVFFHLLTTDYIHVYIQLLSSIS